MEILRCRTRLAVLWVIKALGFFAYLFMRTSQPGVSGTEISEGLLIIMFGIDLWLSWFMAWAVMTLRLTINRWLNSILGIILGILLLITMIAYFDKYSSAIIINYFLGIICYFLIAWYGWKLPKTEG